jgi:ComF family protein
LAPAVDVVFPRRCAGCGSGPWPFCAACRSALVPLEPPGCERCGCPGPEPVPVCAECPPEPLASVRAPFLYAGPARTAIHRLKFSGWRDVASAFAAAITADELPEVDVVTWVPLSRRRRAERGYDQARAIAVGVGRRLDLPVARRLRRPVRTAPQARRGAVERRAALHDAFAPVRAAPADRVLLVDDVLTTGATLAACAEALVSTGVREVHAVTAVRSLSRRRVPPARVTDASS